MDIESIKVQSGKVVFKQVAETCEAGNHVFSKGAKAACDCGTWANFEIAEIVGCAGPETISQEPVLRKKHLALILGGKK